MIEPCEGGCQGSAAAAPFWRLTVWREILGTLIRSPSSFVEKRGRCDGVGTMLLKIQWVVKAARASVREFYFQLTYYERG